MICLIYNTITRFAVPVFVMTSVLYLATPFLHSIVADRKLLRLFIFMAVLFNLGIPLFLMIPGMEDVTKSIMNSADIGIFSGYTGYYCQGYYLHSGVF